MPHRRNVVNENENDNKVEEEVDVSFLSDEQELEQMVRDAQLSTVRCLRCPPAPAEELSSSHMDNNEEDAPIMSSSLFPPATPAPMEKALLNGSLGSFEAFDDEVVLVDFIGDAIEDMNDNNNNSNTLNASSIEEEHLLTARRGVEKFDAGDSSVSRRGSMRSTKSSSAPLVGSAVGEKDILTSDESQIIQDLATMKIDDAAEAGTVAVDEPKEKVF